MTGVDADLATLREALTRWPTASDDTNLAALARVKAELSRLREDRDWQWDKHIEWHRRAEAAEARCAELERERDEAWQDRNEYIDIAEREEARCARLQQALRAYDAAFSEWERGGGIWLGAPALRLWRSMAREALAGPGSEQSSLTESGSAGLPDTPADSQENKT